MTAAPSHLSSGTKSAILPCPFCGSEAIDRRKIDGFPMIYCNGDDCFGPQTTAKSFDDALVQWNTRCSSPAPQIAVGVREALIKKEAKRRCTCAEVPLDQLACQDRRFRHDDRRPWWQAMYVHKIESEIERLEEAGFAISPQAQAGEMRETAEAWVWKDGIPAHAQGQPEPVAWRNRVEFLKIDGTWRCEDDSIDAVLDQFLAEIERLTALPSPPAALPAGLSEQQRHAVEHARYQVQHASPDNPECCFDYELVLTLIQMIDRAYPVPSTPRTTPDAFDRAQGVMDATMTSTNGNTP